MSVSPVSGVPAAVGDAKSFMEAVDFNFRASLPSNGVEFGFCSDAEARKLVRRFLRNHTHTKKTRQRPRCDSVMVPHTQASHRRRRQQQQQHQQGWQNSTHWLSLRSNRDDVATWGDAASLASSNDGGSRVGMAGMGLNGEMFWPRDIFRRGTTSLSGREARDAPKTYGPRNSPSFGGLVKAGLVFTAAARRQRSIPGGWYVTELFCAMGSLTRDVAG